MPSTPAEYARRAEAISGGDRTPLYCGRPSTASRKKSFISAMHSTPENPPPATDERQEALAAFGIGLRFCLLKHADELIAEIRGRFAGYGTDSHARACRESSNNQAGFPWRSRDDRNLG